MLFSLPVQGYFSVNAYIYADESSRHGVLIDPGAQAEALLAFISAKNLLLDAILLTHGHFDHMGAADALHKALQIPILMTQEGRAYAEDPQLNLSAALGPAITLPQVTYFDAKDRPEIPVGQHRLVVAPAPGHTPDSVLYVAPDEACAFVGDTIFRGAIGTTQFPGGDPRALTASIVNEVFTLPNATRLYSGHSDPTSVGEEKARYYGSVR